MFGEFFYKVRGAIPHTSPGSGRPMLAPPMAGGMVIFILFLILYMLPSLTICVKHIVYMTLPVRGTRRVLS